MEEQIVSSAPVQEMNWLARIFNIFFEPRKVFESLKAKPKWLVPFIIVCLITLLFLFLASGIIVSEQIAKTEANQQLTDAQESVIANWIKISMFVFGPIWLALALFAVSLVLYFVFNILMGGDSTFIRVLSVVSHSYLISIPATIVHLPIILIKKSVDVHTSLALVLPVELKEKFLYRFLDGFDIFTLWQVIVLALGLSVMYNFSFKKSFIPILIMWIILILISALLAGLFAGFGGT